MSMQCLMGWNSFFHLQHLVVGRANLMILNSARHGSCKACVCKDMLVAMPERVEL